jgi:VWFA-related protein
MQKFFAVLCATGILLAQAPQDDSKPITVTVHNVPVPVSVLDLKGNSVPGLTPFDFRLFDNGKGQKITEDLAQHPLSVVVVIQANRDVEKILPQIMKQASALESLVLGADGEVAVLAFDHRMQELTAFTSDESQIDIAFKKLKPGSYTAALNDATLKAVGMLKNRPTDRRRVILQIAENRDKGSSSHPREVLTEAEMNNVVIYSMNVSQLLAALTSTAQPNRPDPRPPGGSWVAPGVTSTATTESQMNMGNWVPALKDVFDAAKGVFVKDPLDVYTQYTGGRQCGFKSDKALANCVAQIGEELHSQYLLSYTPTNIADAGFHRIVVEVLKPGYKVRARDGYWIAGRPE